MRITLFLLTLFSSLFGFSGELTTTPTAPPPPPMLVAMQQQLNAEQEYYALLSKKLHSLKEKEKHFSLEKTALVTPAILEQAYASLQLSKTEHENIILNLKTIQLSIDLNQQLVQNLQRQSIDAQTQGYSNETSLSKLQEKRELIKLLQKRVQVLQNTQIVAQNIVSTTQQWYQDLRKKRRITTDTKTQEKANNLASRLQKNQNAWIQQLQSQEAALYPHTHKLDLSPAFNLILVEAENTQLQIIVNLETLEQKLQDLIDTLNEEPALNLLNNLQRQFETICTQLQETEYLLNKKRDALDQVKSEQIQNSKVLYNLNQNIESYNNLLTYAHKLHKQADQHLAKLNQQLRAHLADRKNLPGFNLNSWINLAEQTSKIPKATQTHLTRLYTLICFKIKEVSWIQITLVTGLIIGSFIILMRLLKHPLWRTYTQKFLSSNQGIFFTRIWHVFTRLLNKKYLSTLFISGGITGLLSLLGIPFKLFSWILSLIITATGFHIILQLIGWVLIEYTSEQTEQKTTLYYQLKRALLVGAWVTSANLLVHQIEASYEVQHLFSRLFMAALLAISSILMKNWQLAPQLLETYLEKKPSYLKQSVRWVSFLLPFSLLSNALLGLIGYVQLAWAIATYQGLFLLSTSLYFLIKGLLDNVVRQLSAQSIRRFRNGWLWSEALLKPAHQLIKLTTLIWLTAFFFQLAGWNNEAFTHNITPSTLLSKAVWKIFELTITVKSLIILGVIVSIIVWLSRWMREIAYRVFFATLKDLGLRNSLSTLMQYFSIAFVMIISCYHIGMSLDTVKWMFASFSFGLALGIRDVFNNFVTGILLLLERPMKVGDWVTVGTYDGQVAHIGARSFIINTEDHQELIVPNADVFSKHFVNWTRHDSIVRVTLPILVNRGDNPARVREIILEVLTQTSKILNSPNSEVYFKDTHQMLLEFKVEYYIDLNQISSRAEVRSQFLFALWNRFREENILPPEVLHSLYLHNAAER